MLTPETIEKMNAMKLFGLVSAFETQLSSSEYKELSFEERVGLLVDAEWTAREQRKLSRRLRAAKLRYPACLENVNFQAPRGLNREQILSLGNCRFVGERHNLLITGRRGLANRSWLAPSWNGPVVAASPDATCEHRACSTSSRSLVVMVPTPGF